MKVYYSRSNEVDDAKVGVLLQTFLQNLPGGLANVELTQHHRGDSYNPEKVTNADLVVVGVKDLHESDPEIAKGCYTEIISACKANIPVIVLTQTGYDDPWVHAITECDLFVLNEMSWSIGHAYISLYSDYDYAEECGENCAKITDKLKIQSLMTNLYGEDKLRTLFDPLLPDLDSLESLKSQMSKDDYPVANHTEDTPDDLLLLG